MNMNMKNWLRAGAALLACVFGLLAFYAFQKAELKSETGLVYLTWYYIGDADGQLDPSNYTLNDDSASLCGHDNKEICSIYAPEDANGNVDFSATAHSGLNTVMQEIEDVKEATPKFTNSTVKSLRALNP